MLNPIKFVYALMMRAVVLWQGRRWPVCKDRYILIGRIDDESALLFDIKRGEFDIGYADGTYHMTTCKGKKVWKGRLYMASAVASGNTDAFQKVPKPKAQAKRSDNDFYK